jgi:hypothetical protein
MRSEIPTAQFITSHQSRSFIAFYVGKVVQVGSEDGLRRPGLLFRHVFAVVGSIWFEFHRLVKHVFLCLIIVSKALSSLWLYTRAPRTREVLT